jgi:hypothetical protein
MGLSLEDHGSQQDTGAERGVSEARRVFKFQRREVSPIRFILLVLHWTAVQLKCCIFPEPTMLLGIQ